MTRQGATETREVRQPSVEHILATWTQASEEHIHAGFRWYQAAHDLAVDLDPVNPRRAAGVIAALSPQTNWDRNAALARLAYAQGVAFGTLGSSVRAANRILAGEDPADVLRGPKVIAFFTLINDPSNTSAVVVDRHAIGVAVGARLSDRERNASYRLDRGGLYGRIADVYRAAADVLQVPPHAVQAVTWLVHRDTLPTRRDRWAPAI